MNPYLYSLLKIFNRFDKNTPPKPKVTKSRKAITAKKTQAKKVLTKVNNTKKAGIKKIVRHPIVRALTPSKHIEKHISLKTIEGNPILQPTEKTWETWQTFNPGVVLLDDKVHLLYRAIGDDGLSRFGYAVSNDGFTIDERLEFPVYTHEIANSNSFNYSSYASGGSFGGAEDCRIVYIKDEGRLYITYTACDQGLRVGLSSISRYDFLNKKWNWDKPHLISRFGEVHKNWVIFPEKFNGKYAILHNIARGIKIEFVDRLLPAYTYDIKSPDPHSNPVYRKEGWDNYIRGVGGTPIKTKHGWLIFYHAMDKTDYSKYKIGAMILDLKDPTKVLFRSKKPILEPNDFHYENNGFKPGVVYTTGAIIKDDTLLLYYGASDSYVSVAHTDIDLFLDALTHNRKPNLFVRLIEKTKEKFLKKVTTK